MKSVHRMILTLTAVAFALTGAGLSSAHAQNVSASGGVSGGNTISAVVPGAGQIYALLDEIEALADELETCGSAGQLHDGSGGCRGGRPPVVEFSTNRVEVEYHIENENRPPPSWEYITRGNNTSDHIVVTR